MNIAIYLHEYNLKIIRLKRIQARTRKARVKKKIENRIRILKERAVEVITEYYVFGIDWGCENGDTTGINRGYSSGSHRNYKE